MSILNKLFRKKQVKDALSAADIETAQGGGLEKSLSVWDLTALGIAAIIGAGIFSTIGSASYSGGPGVVFLFLFTAVACGFAAFAYAEFASMLPVSGSAYTYSYVAFGELIAWIIGWALIMEYAVGNITVAVSWSSYFTSLCESVGWKIPAWAQLDYPSAQALHKEVGGILLGGSSYESLTAAQKEGYDAWTQAPKIGGLHIILDLPAIVMSLLITALVYVGIRESKTAGNMMVILKMGIVLLVIIVGVFYVNPANWNPFFPNGFAGVMGGVSSVFFAYIGFDALSTTAEECKNPQRDLPRAMVYSIIICTVFYIIISLVLTGMVSYKQLNVTDPLAYVFDELKLSWFAGVIAVSAVVAMAGVFLVFQLGQPRIWMAMSRDGLLPKRFSHIHPKFKTPDFATVITAIFVIVPMLFIPSALVTDLCSMGTLFAFVLVCAGVLKLQITPNAPRGKFRTPYLNGKWLFPLLVVAGIAYLMLQQRDATLDWVSNRPVMFKSVDLLERMSPQQIADTKERLAQTDPQGMAAAASNLNAYLESLRPEAYAATVKGLPLEDSVKFEAGWQLFRHKIPMWLFLVTILYLSVLAFRHSLSMIPMLGLSCCFYMMAQIQAMSWLGFFIWLAIGLLIYFGYGYRNSKLHHKQ